MDFRVGEPSDRPPHLHFEVRLKNSAGKWEDNADLRFVRLDGQLLFAGKPGTYTIRSTGSMDGALILSYESDGVCGGIERSGGALAGEKALKLVDGKMFLREWILNSSNGNISVHNCGSAGEIGTISTVFLGNTATFITAVKNKNGQLKVIKWN